jgi:hypothetical protein
MHLYRCDLVLHDYLFFATTERGKVAETGPFVHNYALTYALGKPISAAYPDWGFAKCLRPAAHFCFYVLSRERKVFPRYIRLGKFMAKAELWAEHARQLAPATGPCQADTLLAWDDLAVKPQVFDLRADALPTRLVNHAHFADVPHLRAHFPDGEVTLPLATGYMAAADERTKKEFKRCKHCTEALKFLETALCNSW